MVLSKKNWGGAKYMKKKIYWTKLYLEKLYILIGQIFLKYSTSIMFNDSKLLMEDLSKPRILHDKEKII